MPVVPSTNDPVEVRFSAAAASYDRHAAIQDRVSDVLMPLVDEAPHVDRLLEIGCGTGRLTRRLQRSRPEAFITAIDVSARMLEHARRSVADSTRIDWIASNVCDFEPVVPFPLVVSSSALHWVFPIAKAIAAVDRCLAEGGITVIALMLRGTLRELHESRHRVATHKPPASRLPTLDEVVASTREIGWTVLHQSNRVFNVNHASPQHLLRALHEQGLTGGAVSRSGAPLTRGELNQLKKDYAANYSGADGSVTASFEVGFVVARKCDGNRSSSPGNAR